MPRQAPQSKADSAAQPASPSAGKAAARPAGGARGKAGQTGQSATLITVVLALALLAVGAASYQAATLLRYASTTPPNATAAGAAALVCDTLTRQDYQQLAGYIDPAPVPPAVAGAYDAQATIAKLRSLDARDGAVVACHAAPYSNQSIVSTDGATRYQLTLRRAHSTLSSSGTLVLRQQSSGAHGWLIGRDSSFLTAP
ncbi:MAG TPA: hypothetical protein VFX31_12605 [Ktedonobacterales bacterium]|nr:hypothetical protein [Ktedonobacterales bacterium]